MAKLFLESTDTTYKVANGNTQVFGATGTQAIIVDGSLTGVTLDANVERVQLTGATTDYTYKQTGNSLEIYSGTNLVAKTTLQGDADGTKLTFANGTVDAKLVESTTGAPTVSVGGATVTAVGTTATAAPITVTTIDPTQASTPSGVAAPAVAVTADKLAVNEGEALTVTIKTATAVTADTSFTYKVPANVSVEAGDFEGATSGQVKILAGSDTVSFQVKVAGDNVPELAQNFDIQVADSTGKQIFAQNTLINDVIVDKTAPVIGAITSVTALATNSTNNIEYTENQAISKVIGKVAATDDASGISGFDIVSGDTNHYFDIDDATGNIILTDAGIAAGVATNDFETTPNTFTLGVVAYDGANNPSATKEVKIGVTNIDDDAPVFQNAVANSTTVVLNFNEALSSAPTSIPSSNDFTVTETVNGTVSQKLLAVTGGVGINSGSVILTLQSALTSGSTVKVSYTPGTNALKDVVGNRVAAVSNQTAATDLTAPTLSSSSPADDSTGVAVASNIELNFSESVKAGSGNIVITNSTNAADTRTISVTDANQVTFSGTKIIINPTADLTASANYYVTMASGVVLDSIGNAFAGISSSSTLNFSTPGATGSTTGNKFYLTQAGDNVVGTDGDDTIYGLMDNGAITFNSTLDSVAGGAGTDTFIAYGQSTTGQNFSKVTGIENYVLRATGATDFDMSTTSGYTSLKNEGSTATLDFVRVGSASTSLNIQGANSDTGFAFTTAALVGNADSVTVNVDGFTATAAPELVLSSGIETLNVASTGSKSSFKIATDNATDGTTGADTAGYASATKLTVSGAANLTIANSFTNAKTVDLSASSGGVSVDLTGNTTVLTVTGGAGNDTVTVTGTTIDKTTATADSIKLGAGTDTLAVASATIAAGGGTQLSTANYATFLAAVNAVVSETEGLKFNNATVNSDTDNLASVDLSAYTNGMTNFTFATSTTGATGSPTITVTGLKTANSLTFASTTGFATAAAAGATAVSIQGASAGQTANITLGGGAVITGGVAPTTALDGGVAVLLSGVSKVVLTSSGTTANQVVGGATSGNGGAGNDSYAFSGVSSFELKGAQDITIKGGAGDTGGTNLLAGFAAGVSVDASTYTGTSTIYLANDATTGDAFVGGTGADKVYGLAGADNLAGSAGDDSLHGGAGKDTLIGGDGDDTLVTAAFPTATGGALAESLTGGNGTDKFYISNANALAETEANIVANTYVITDFNASGEKLYLSADGDAAPTNAQELLGNTALTDLTWNATTGVLATDNKVINIGSLASASGQTTVAGDLLSMFVATTASAGKIASTNGSEFIVAFNSARDSSTYVAVINDAATAGVARADDSITLIKLTGVAVGDISAADFELVATASWPA